MGCLLIETTRIVDRPLNKLMEWAAYHWLCVCVLITHPQSTGKLRKKMNSENKPE